MKKNIKPLMSVKHDFVDSLDEFIQAAVMLHLSVKSALELGQIGEKLRPVIEARVAAFDKAYLRDEA
jgi:hypothetical protein